MSHTYIGTPLTSTQNSVSVPRSSHGNTSFPRWNDEKSRMANQRKGIVRCRLEIREEAWYINLFHHRTKKTIPKRVSLRETLKHADHLDRSWGWLTVGRGVGDVIANVGSRDLSGSWASATPTDHHHAHPRCFPRIPFVFSQADKMPAQHSGEEFETQRVPYINYLESWKRA